jgi:glycosyltransferase involved in cell wall biosynthesis
MNVSVIATVMNEGDALRPLLESLLYQTRPPDEIVISDGGSTDNTRDVLAEYQPYLPLTIIDATGANISAGRNVAIAAAAGPIIAVTDAGVVLGPNWLEALTAPLQEEEARVVAGWFEADPYTDFEVVMGATVLPSLAQITPETFLPSSRSVAFLKEAWQAAGGYPEWLDYCEDLIFDINLRATSGAIVFAPQAVAYFRPRGSMGAFFKQYYRYARGDGKANLWWKRHLLRYATYLLAVPLLLRLIWRGRWPGVPLLLAGVAAYSYRPVTRLWPLTRGWSPPGRLRAVAQVPLIRLVGDVAKMIGYPVGLWWRWRHRGSDHQAPALKEVPHAGHR